MKSEFNRKDEHTFIRYTKKNWMVSHPCGCQGKRRSHQCWALAAAGSLACLTHDLLGLLTDGIVSLHSIHSGRSQFWDQNLLDQTKKLLIFHIFFFDKNKNLSLLHNDQKETGDFFYFWFYSSPTIYHDWFFGSDFNELILFWCFKIFR